MVARLDAWPTDLCSAGLAWVRVPSFFSITYLISNVDSTVCVAWGDNDCPFKRSLTKKTNVHRKWSVTFICVGQLVARCLVECSAADTKQAGSISVHIVLIVHESFNAVLSPTDPINDSLETMVSLF